MNIAIVLIQMLTFLSYILYVTVKYDKQPSISHSWYLLPSNRKFLFTITMWIVALGQLVHIQISEWFFLSAVGFGFVGAATTFNDDKVTYWVHFIGALIGIIGSLFGLNSDIYLFIWILLVVGWMWLNDEKHVIWDVEVFFLILIGISLVFKYLK